MEVKQKQEKENCYTCDNSLIRTKTVNTKDSVIKTSQIKCLMHSFDMSNIKGKHCKSYC